MDNSLVFNTTYKSLAAEWLGLSSNQETKRKSDKKVEKDKDVDDDIEEDIAVESSKQNHVLKKHKEFKGSSHGEKKKGEARNFATSLEMGEKLQKKLTKARKRAHDRHKDDSIDMKKSSTQDSDEESKFDVVKKSRLDKGGKEAVKSKALTADDIKKRLKDQTLSKPARKRLKRKLRILEENSGKQPNEGKQPASTKNHTSKNKKTLSGKSEAKLKRKEIEEFSKSFTDQTSTGVPTVGKKNLSKSDDVKTENNASESDSQEEYSSKTFTKVKKLPDTVSPSPSKKKKNKKKSLFSDLKDSKHKLDKVVAEKKLIPSQNGTKDQGKNESQNADATNENKDGSVKKKRKRPKKRSKQKNIKKDHRPEEMRPSYMQGAGMKRVSMKTVPSKNEDKESRQS